MSFKAEYHKYLFDICTHCNLYQKKFNHVNVPNSSGDEVHYIYNCQHCHKMYPFTLKREVLTMLNRPVDQGLIGYVLPEYVELNIINYN